MHYGTPQDVQVTDPDFAERYADFAAAAARHLRGRGPGPTIYNPINEISFLAWALAAQAILGGECSERDGYDVKVMLVQAALRGIQAIRVEDPDARFIHIEPLIHVVAPRAQPELAPAASNFCGFQWQVWDMLLGRCEPQLGGSPSMLDWAGVNHYHDGQWEIDTGACLDWDRGDERRAPFASLLHLAWLLPACCTRPGCVTACPWWWPKPATSAKGAPAGCMKLRPSAPPWPAASLFTACACIRSWTGRTGTICSTGTAAACGTPSHPVRAKPPQTCPQRGCWLPTKHSRWPLGKPAFPPDRAQWPCWPGGQDAGLGDDQYTAHQPKADSATPPSLTGSWARHSCAARRPAMKAWSELS